MTPGSTRLIAVSLCLAAGLSAQPGQPPLPKPASQDAKMAWFREAKFGLFIHWGLYAIPAGEWKGKPISSGTGSAGTVGGQLGDRQRWHNCCGVARRGRRAVRQNPGTSTRCIADFDGHLLAEDCEGGLDLLGLGGVFGIEHTADHALVESQAASQLGVADALIAHGVSAT